MKTRTLIRLLIIESAVIVRLLTWTFGEGTGGNRTELLRETSPDGDYVLLIEELGTPSSFFYSLDRIQVTLCENSSHEYYCASFRADIPTRGDTAEYEIQWMEDSVQIILSGHESQYYILPFKTLEDSTMF
ncbi:MAG: hypothetical protein NC517_00540 [Firmicutes bacterium]|nr:hypothetical protein [Bacillota bacterium]